MADSYITFEDEQIRLRIPRQLRLKRGTSYFFSGVLKRGQKDSRFGFALLLDPPPVLRKGMRQVIFNALPRDVWLGVEIRVIRKGRCFFGDGGIEVLGTYTNPITVFCRWVVLYKLGKHYLHMDLSGGGDLGAFEKMGTQIIRSIVVK